jgi:hypothetical protein
MKGCGKVERDTRRHSRPEKGNGVLRRCEKIGGLLEFFGAHARLSRQGREIGRNLLPGGMNGNGEGPDRFRFFSRFRGKDHGVSPVQDAGCAAEADHGCLPVPHGPPEPGCQHRLVFVGVRPQEQEGVPFR